MIIHSSQNPYKVLGWNNGIGDFYTIAWATNRQEAEECAKAFPVRAIVRDSFDSGSLVFDNKKQDFV